MEPRDYQLSIAAQAVDLLQNHKIAFLIMQVRTGKTVTAFLTAKNYGAKNTLFVTKLKAISGIQADLLQFDAAMAVHFVNYESLHKLDGDFDFVILDESHSIAQFPIPAKRTELLRDICKGLPILYLSGTPTPETFAQWFHQFWVSSFSPFKHRNFYAWHKDFGIPKKKYVYNRELADYSDVKTDEIRAVVAPYLLTYTQDQAGFKSPVVERVVTLPMPERIAQAIKLLKRDKLIRTKSGKVVLADTAVKEMGKIHQISSGTVKDEDGGVHLVSYHKTQYILDHFDGQKIAIFYKYWAELQLLKNTFGSRLVTDSVAFNAAGPDAVFVSQIQSGREGINISSADCLIMLNIDFSATSYWQARARLQTRDRQEPAIVVWLFTDGGLEKYVYDVVQKKRDFTLSHYYKINMQ